MSRLMIEVLPAPVAPTRATLLPGLDREVDVPQHPGRVLARRVVGPAA